MKFSVVIPTYNNVSGLEKCLQHLNAQNFPDDFEVIVVDDGSIDGTQKLLSEWQNKQTRFILKSVFQENKKQGAARNRGVMEASGEIIIFIGSDILVTPDWLNAHKKFHEKFFTEEYIGVGFMTFSPELMKDRFRKWLEDSGTILSYRGLKNYEPTNFWHFYTGNISMKKSLFLKYKFDEEFTCYGWEDIMLGYRMLKDGAQLIYIEEAKAWHDHALTIADFFPERMREIGKSAVVFDEKFPEVGVIPSGIKLAIFKILSGQWVAFLLGVIKKEWRWYAESKRYFLEGVKSVKRPIKNVLIIGSYGASNIGDEEMLSVILKKLPENLGKFVLSGNIDDTKKQHPDAKNVSLHFPFGIRSFFSFRWIKSFSYLKKCDLVLFGGGGLFTDSHSLRAILLWSWQVFWASIYGKRIVFFGVSFGKLKSKFAKSLTTWAVKKSEKIYVRDKMSFQIIDKMGFREKVYLGSDLTFLKDINILNVPKRKILALNFREFKADLTVFSRFVEYAKREGYEILLTALENHDAELMKSMNLNLPIFQPGNFDNLIAKLAECEFVVGMRLHFLIAGVLAGCKVSGVSYDVKVGGVLNEMDIFSIGINEIKDEYFADLLYKAKTASHLEVVKLRAMQGWENFLSFLATK